MLTTAKGQPRAWTPPNTATKLKKDEGKYFRDPNAARYPAHPMEPAVQAIFATQPHFTAHCVDIFACSSTLGSLLRFVRKVDKPFRMLVEAVGDTVFFVRREKSPKELIPDVRGFGHTFPAAYTTWEPEVKRSESHHRVVRYTFGGLDCLVRLGVDGYHKDLAAEQPKVERKSELDGTDISEVMLTSALNSTKIGVHPTAIDKPLAIIQGGQRIPQSAIFDLKTRSFRKKDHDTIGEEMPRLWVAQIPNFILAYHDSGVFEDIQTRNVRQEIEDWEHDNEETLRRFGVLLRKIVAFARGRRDRKLEVRCREVDILELREQKEEVGRAVPATVEARWIRDRLSELGTPSVGSGGVNVGDFSEPDDDGRDSFEWDEGSEKDFTACSAEYCGYCGHCSY
jgi:hypothetical protein